MGLVSIKMPRFQLAQAELMKELKDYAPKNNVTVGFHADTKAGAPHPNKSKTKRATLTTVEIARINHYGVEGKIPARPFLDVSIAQKQGDLMARVNSDLRRGLTPDKAMDRLGARAVGIVQKYITDLRTPPNSPRTIARKGSSNPLIDTGLMRQSVTYQKKPK